MMNNHIVVLGKHGLLGETIYRLYPSVTLLSRAECDLSSFMSIRNMVYEYQPDIVINAAGITPKHPEQNKSVWVNALGPRLLEDFCLRNLIKVIHISTADIFENGPKRESDFPNNLINLYTITKYLGETIDMTNLTVRCSFVGLPDERGRGLLSWAQQQEKIIGYDGVYWNGITAIQLARLIMEIFIPKDTQGVIHAFGPMTTKYDMLVSAKKILGFKADIVKQSDVVVPDEVIRTNRTLDSEYDIGNKIDFSIEDQLKEYDRDACRNNVYQQPATPDNIEQDNNILGEIS